MELLVNTLTENHGVASAAQLHTAGVTARDLRKAVADGDVLRVRKGWFALPGTSEAERLAVANGGVLSCVSALAAAGLWVIRPDGVHIAVRRHTGSVRSRGSVTLHWRRWAGCGTTSASVDGIAASLLHLIMCVPADDAIVTLDSAVNSEKITLDDLLALGSLLPLGKRGILDRVDPGCQSGLETRVRIAFTRRGLQVRTQVHIDGVGRVDVLIGDRLVVETDGRRYHSTSDQIDDDYRRDLALFDLGYARVRANYGQIMNDWPHTRGVIERAIERGVHLWTPAQRRSRERRVSE